MDSLLSQRAGIYDSQKAIMPENLHVGQPQSQGQGQNQKDPAAPLPVPDILAGFEWEFLVAATDQEKTDHHPLDTRWFSRPDDPEVLIARQQQQQRGMGRPPRIKVEGADNDDSSVASESQGQPRLSALFETRKRLLARVEQVLRRDAQLPVFSHEDLTRNIFGVGGASNLLVKYGMVPVPGIHTEFLAYSVGSDVSLCALPDFLGTLDGGDYNIMPGLGAGTGTIHGMDMRYKWLGVEVKSRVFTQREIAPTPTSATDLASTSVGGSGESESEDPEDNSVCAREVNRLCSALRNNMRLQINTTCALQVTVSHQTGGGLSLISLKKIATLAWILEGLLFKLCAKHRQGCAYCLPLATQSVAAFAYKDHCAKRDKVLFGGVGGGGGRNNNGHDGDDSSSRPPTTSFGEAEHLSGNYYWDPQFEDYVGSALKLVSEKLKEQRATTSSSSSNVIYPPPPPDRNERQQNTLTRIGHALQAIWRARTKKDLSNILQRGGATNPAILGAGTGYSRLGQRLSLAIKFHGFSEPPTVAAVEFRMHEGTLDPVLSKMWMDVCVAIVKTATTHTDRVTSGRTPLDEVIARSGSSVAYLSALVATDPDGPGDGDTSKPPPVNIEALSFNDMIRSFLDKIMGTGGDDFDPENLKTSLPSKLLRELGISPRSIALWERKIATIHGTGTSPPSNMPDTKGKGKEKMSAGDVQTTMPMNTTNLSTQVGSGGISHGYGTQQPQPQQTGNTLPLSIQTLSQSSPLQAPAPAPRKLFPHLTIAGLSQQQFFPLSIQTLSQTTSLAPNTTNTMSSMTPTNPTSTSSTTSTNPTKTTKFPYISFGHNPIQGQGQNTSSMPPPPLPPSFTTYRDRDQSTTVSTPTIPTIPTPDTWQAQPDISLCPECQEFNAQILQYHPSFLPAVRACTHPRTGTQTGTQGGTNTNFDYLDLSSPTPGASAGTGTGLGGGH